MEHRLFGLNVAEPDRFLEELTSNADGAAFVTESHAEARIAGHTLPLGKMRTHMPAARVSNLEGVRRALRRQMGRQAVHIGVWVAALAGPWKCSS